MTEQKRKIKISVRRYRKLKWGIAGCGNFLENTFLPTMQQIKRSNLRAIYSSDINRAKFIANKFNAAVYFNDYEKFLENDFTAVYISSKNSDHYKQVIAAAEAGKHILCEKPLALNSKEAEEMVKACADNNVFLTINYSYRFHPLIVKAKELINSNVIGKIVSVRTNFNIDFPPNENYRFSKEHGGGALMDLGTHMIDLLRFFGGEIESIKGYIDNVIYKTEVDDYATGLVKFKRSGYGSFDVSFNTKKQFNRIEILGYKGALSIDKVVGKRNASSKLTIQLSGEAKKAFRKRANKQAYLLKSIHRSFINNEEPLVTGQDGLLNIILMEELLKQCR